MLDKDADWTKLWTLVSITFTTKVFFKQKNSYIWVEIGHYSIVQFDHISVFEAL